MRINERGRRRYRGRFCFLGLFAKTQFVIFLLVMISIISCLASGYHVIIM